jgi:TRAP-type mannitol/chloroaromatic compound transport system permease small subunit
VTIQIAGVLAILAGGYTLLHKGHIAVDTLIDRFTPKTRTIIDIITLCITLFIIGGLLWSTAGEAIDSLKIKESFTSYIAPPIYPFKIIMALGIALLLLQGIANLVRDLEAVIRHEGENQK